MATLSKATLFDPKVVNDLIDGVYGHSSIAALSAQKPVAFNGNKEFIFTLDNEVDIVAENGAKSHGGATVTAKTIVPIKVEYGARVSDEFMYASEEEQLDILRAFADGAAKKVARGLDIMAFLGVNPRTGTASTIIDDNCFATGVTNNVTYSSTDPDGNVSAAIALLDADADATGVAMSKDFQSALAAQTEDGKKLYPQLAWGAKVSELNGLRVDTNSTLSFNSSTLKAVVGDFEGRFKWGIAKEIPLEVIPYGNPDNSDAGDLKGHNQVYLRCEVYIGWAILDPTAFAKVTAAANAGGAGGAG